jgi:hypothetical protein
MYCMVGGNWADRVSGKTGFASWPTVMAPGGCWWWWRSDMCMCANIELFSFSDGEGEEAKIKNKNKKKQITQKMLSQGREFGRK